MYFCVSVYMENTRVNNGISTQHHTVHSIILSMISDKFFYNIEEKKKLASIIYNTFTYFFNPNIHVK